MDKKVVVLVTPPSRAFYPVYESQLSCEYLSGALLQNGYNPTILEQDLFQLSERSIVSRIKQLDPLFIGVSIMENHIYEDLLRPLLQKIKESCPTTVIIVGGFQATFYPEETLRALPHCDAVAIGEGERTIVEIADTLQKGENLLSVRGLCIRDNNGYFYTNPQYQIENIDNIPFPDRRNYGYVRNHGTIPRMYSSRGCWARCKFCEVPSFFVNYKGDRKWRARSPENIIEEIKILKKKFQVNWINFVDDSFMGPGRLGIARYKRLSELLRYDKTNIKWFFSCRATDVTEEMLKTLVPVGLRRLFIGIESCIQDDLERLGKITNVSSNIYSLQLCKKYGIVPSIGFIMFLPWSSLKSIHVKLKFLGELEEVDFYSSTPLTIRKGTAFYHEYGNITTPHNFGYSFDDHGVESFYRWVQKKEQVVSPYLETTRQLWRYLLHESEKTEQILLKIHMKALKIDLNFMKKISDLIGGEKISQMWFQQEVTRVIDKLKSLVHIAYTIVGDEKVFHKLNY